MSVKFYNYFFADTIVLYSFLCYNLHDYKLKCVEYEGISSVMEQKMKIAVLIDAENISSKYIDVILNEVNSIGNVIYKRIYGDWTVPGMNSWKEVILNNSIQPIQQYRNAAGKNSTDSSLIIDAMDLLYLGRLNGFCIVSSDSDFTRIAARLRESEMYLLGMGEQKTPRSFISACNTFSYLDTLYERSKKVKEHEAKKNFAAENNASVTAKLKASGKTLKVTAKNIDRIKQLLKEITEENADSNGWIFLGELGGFLSKRFPKFDVKKYGYSKLSRFVESLDMFDIKQDSPELYYRLK